VDPDQGAGSRIRWKLRSNAYLDLTSVWSEQASSTGTSRAQSTTLLLSIDF